LKTLKHYIQSGFLTTFLISVAVFSFVLSIGGLFKLTDLVTRGLAPGPILGVFLSGLPLALAFAIPISGLTSALLFFGRISADHEITAMRACGINMWRVMAWIAPVAIVQFLACVYINSELIPHSRYTLWLAMSHLGADNPADLIEEGRTIQEFDGISVYVERKRGEVLENIRLFDEREAGRTREIKAERGRIFIPTNSNDIVLSLEQVTIDPFSFERPGSAYSGKWSVRIPDVRRKGTYRRRDKDQTLVELYMQADKLIQDAEVRRVAATSRKGASALEERLAGMQTDELRSRSMRMMVTFHKRLVLSIASVGFIFLGIPMGIGSHRKDSSKGIGLSLLIVFAFYMMITFAEQFAGRPAFRPDLLVWIPAVLLLILDVALIRRLN